jgi:cysteine/O-acetylserine efflux protein
MNTARCFGFKKTLPLMVGMFCGLLVIMTLNAVANIFIAELMPKVLPYLSIAGSLYLLWLAWKIAFPEIHENGTNAAIKVPKFTDGFILQFLNPKTCLFGFTALSTFIAPWTKSRAVFFAFGVVLAAGCAGGFVSWALFGGLQHKYFAEQSRKFDIIMGLLLIWCAISVSGVMQIFTNP